MDKLVIDIETSNTFADVGSRDNFHDLKVSVIGAYSYKEDKFFAFHENQIQEFAPFLQRAGLVIGFAINRFDIPVLKKHFAFDIFALERLDLLEEIELKLGQRVSLSALAKANLGIGKEHHGLEAIKMYRDGNLEELKNYCLNDVRLTRDLYELAKRQGYLLVPEKNNPINLLRAEFNLQEIALPATLF